jgi:hypothetical protein
MTIEQIEHNINNGFKYWHYSTMEETAIYDIPNPQHFGQYVGITDKEIAGTQSIYSLQALKGRSLPSSKFGAWIVDQVSPTVNGRSRLVTANLKGEQWINTWDLVCIFHDNCRSN